jgi:hypothetical protein
MLAALPGSVHSIRMLGVSSKIPDAALLCQRFHAKQKPPLNQDSPLLHTRMLRIPD